MKLYLIGHDYRYECEKICRIYYPAEDFEFIKEDSFGADADGVYARITEEDGETAFYAEAAVDGKRAFSEERAPSDSCREDGDREKRLARCMVKSLTEITGLTPPWGILTGVRPSKLMMKYIAEKGADAAEEEFTGFPPRLPAQ